MKGKLIEWMNGKTILFLAKYAPVEGNSEYDTSKDVPYSAEYHNEIYKLLARLPVKIISSRDPGILFNSNYKFNYVFSLYNKIPCKNGEIYISAICEYLKIPYLGANPNMRCIAEDKHLAKIIALRSNLDVLPWSRWNKSISKSFEGPYMVKPRFGGGSVGINEDSYQSNWEDAYLQSEVILKKIEEPIIEQFCDGLNVTLPIIGGNIPKILPPVLIQSTGKFNIITENEKFSLDHSKPYELYTGSEYKKIIDSGLSLIKELDQLDYTRIDFRVNEKDNKSYFLEFNLCCDIASTGSFISSATSTGLNHYQTLIEILHVSLVRSNLI